MFIPDQADAARITDVFMVGVMMNDAHNTRRIREYVLSAGQTHPWIAPYVALLWTCAAEQVHFAKYNCWIFEK